MLPFLFSLLYRIHLSTGNSPFFIHPIISTILTSFYHPAVLAAVPACLGTVYHHVILGNVKEFTCADIIVRVTSRYAIAWAGVLYKIWYDGHTEPSDPRYLDRDELPRFEIRKRV
ncbi:uncharacterized protein BDZ99DRAFT_518450 [Mytilinidion resinicola]|uniref:Uncharacterized protein n=1 Tax=Mytilinidion resinicola TaxID=574789 RepID=A0A6A6YUM3_9PEZI|nr:uncharacterized protein BDZ99DRAFT_518450 [Mytilinidion resinicola]KAF2812632.1 hypothetical protein BDZ99DRAFT_518450 [Mytilinidion resinicola]